MNSGCIITGYTCMTDKQKVNTLIKTAQARTCIHMYVLDGLATQTRLIDWTRKNHS